MKYVVGILVIIILAIGGYALFAHKAAAPAASTDAAMGDMDMGTSSMADIGAASTTSGSGVSVGVSASVGNGVTVAYTASGFSPATVTIKAGQSVTFVNQSGSPMWVATDPHPEHTGYDGTTREQHCAAGYAGPAPFDECGTASSFTFTFTKVGSWGYHNHMNPAEQGTVVVTQ